MDKNKEQKEHPAYRLHPAIREVLWFYGRGKNYHPGSSEWNSEDTAIEEDEGLFARTVLKQFGEPASEPIGGNYTYRNPYRPSSHY